jgi:glycerophosphoryl diester phosphodiesterase
LNDINQYATGIGFQDSIIWDYKTHSIKDVLKETQKLGMIAHIWTFKDDVLMFETKNNIDMYTIGQKDMKLDGIIT